MRITRIFISIFFLIPLLASGAEPSRRTPTVPGAGSFQILTAKADQIEARSTTDGWAYIVSGGVALLLSTPAFYLTEDTFAKAIYSLGQTLGVTAIGYGSYLVLLQNDYTHFKNIVGSTSSLTPQERDELAYKFLQVNAQKARSIRKIRTITHGLTAALNFSSAITTENKDLKTALYFVGGINVLAALNFALRPSEEEEFLERNSRAKAAWTVTPILGRVAGVRIEF